jgi:hypothetical protein
MIVATIVLWPVYCRAGPCLDEIEKAQDQLDVTITAIIDTARFARDARAAFGLPAAAPLGLPALAGVARDGSSIGEAVALLAQAREADRRGDDRACQQAVAEMRRALGR